MWNYPDALDDSGSIQAHGSPAMSEEDIANAREAESN